MLLPYDANLANNSGWTCSVKDSMSRIGLLTVFLNKTKMNPNTIVFRRERDIFYQEAFYKIQNVSKLQTFALIKTDIGPSEYLSVVQKIPDRIAMTKLRLSNHLLLIEKGRHTNIERQQRLCPFCPHHIEDEFHFLIKCPAYSHLRINLLDGIKNKMPDFHIQVDEKFLFWFLLKCHVISNFTANFISLATDLRNFLLVGHKNYY